MQTMQQQQWLINIWHKGVFRITLDLFQFTTQVDFFQTKKYLFFRFFYFHQLCHLLSGAIYASAMTLRGGSPSLGPVSRGPRGGGDLVRGPGVWRPGLWVCPTLGQRGCVPARISPEGNKPFPPASLKRHHTYQLPERLQGTGSLNEVLRLV